MDLTYALGTSITAEISSGYVSARFTRFTELCWVISTSFPQAVSCEQANTQALYTA